MILKPSLMARVLLTLGLAYTCERAGAQTTGSFFVGGTSNTFYPVTFVDAGWNNNVPTVLQVGRSYVHTDGLNHGSLTANFTYRVNQWGNGANFINAQMEQNPPTGPGPMIAGWVDPTYDNSAGRIIIWFKGASTYYYASNYPVSPMVYDGVANALPYNTPSTGGGTVHSYNAVTSVATYVNLSGSTSSESIVSTSTNPNYLAGGLGIGVGSYNLNGYSLAVNGNVHAKSIKVESSWSDFVFDKGYRLPPLTHLEGFINKHHHLPEIPTEATIKANGVDLAEANRKLLQKVEELTLYIIDLDKRYKRQEKRIEELEKK